MLEGMHIITSDEYNATNTVNYEVTQKRVS